MRNIRISYVPLVLGLVGMLAMVALVQDRNVRTWAVVMGLTTVAAVSYGGYQEHLATKTAALARRRGEASPREDLQRELDRARRHERPFALARITLPGPDGRDDARELAATLRSSGAVRTTDRIWRSGSNVYFLLPETSSETARTVVVRTIGDTSAASIDWRVVSFPEDGVTTGSLLESLHVPAGVRSTDGAPAPLPALRAAAKPVPVRRDEEQ